MHYWQLHRTKTCSVILKEAIITYKKKIEPLQFYKEIKKGQKRREKYGDMQLKDDMDRCNPLFWFFGTSTRQELYERKKKRMEKKQRRIPKK